MALLNFAAPLVVAVGPLAGALITEIIDWRAAFVFAGVAGLLFVPYFRWAVRDPSVQTRGEGVVAVGKLAPPERRDGLKALVKSTTFRSAGRPGGKECVCKCIHRGSPLHKKKN